MALRVSQVWLNKPNFYEVLGIKSGATTAEVKSAYYERSLKYHPDHNPGCKIAEAKFSELQEAYKVLGQEHLRERYDFVNHKRKPSSQMRNIRKSGAFTDSKVRYDLNSFYQQHYGKALREEQIRRQKREEERKKLEAVSASGENKWYLLTAVVLCGFILQTSGV
eukprot:m.27734 g.27734  ORF g.27734 m.27734 type:complete len:165 (+) comp7928_c0_seq1:233-727(+)